jgi:hypothetical protein
LVFLSRQADASRAVEYIYHYRYCTCIVLYYVRRWPLAADRGGPMPVAYPSPVLYVNRSVLRRPLASRRPPGGPMPVVDHHRYCTYIVLYYVRRWPISPPTGGLMPVAPLPYRYCTYHQRKAPARRLAYNGTPLAHSGLTALKIESVSETFSQYVGGRQPTYRLRTHTDRIRIL